MILKWRTAGQACTQASRVYMQSGVYDKFARMIVEATTWTIHVGHGAEPSTKMGPLATSRGIGKLERHVQDAVKHGGKILCGGKRPSNLNGYF